MTPAMFIVRAEVFPISRKTAMLSAAGHKESTQLTHGGAVCAKPVKRQAGPGQKMIPWGRLDVLTAQACLRACQAGQMHSLVMSAKACRLPLSTHQMQRQHC